MAEAPTAALPTRTEALRHIVAAYPDAPTVVTLGATTRELIALDRRPNHLYVLDSMGLPAPIAVGLALALKSTSVDKVVCIEGDGSLLMGLSIFATIGHVRPDKLVLITLDNGAYAATGGQATAAPDIDLSAMARAGGMVAEDVPAGGDIPAALERTRAATRASFLRIAIDKTNLKTGYFLENPVILGHQFETWLRGICP